MVALAVLLIVLGGLGGAFLLTALSHRVSVIVMAKDVAVGQTISQADLATATLAADTAVARIGAQQRDQVVGQIAAVDLKTGMLLTVSALTSQTTPDPGQQVVVVAVKPSQIPARGLHPGDPVKVIPLSDDQSATSTPPDAAKGATRPIGSLPASGVGAVVCEVAGPDADGLVVVDLLVDDRSAPLVAQYAAGGHVAFTLIPRSG
jgi:hypothetical protein